ncbi:MULTISPECIES: hypothetical protein [unclassified Thermococcus]|nr:MULTISPECIES: hypothetical protein [unclassified Thermococcus]
MAKKGALSFMIDMVGWKWTIVGLAVAFLSPFLIFWILIKLGGA